jgi:hypothetical protein
MIKNFLKNTATGKLYEVLGRDKASGTITLKGEYGTFTETFDKEQLLKLGYELVKQEVPAPEADPEEE